MENISFDQATDEVMELASVYTDNYVNYCERVPFELQRNVTRLREIDCSYREHLASIETLYEAFKTETSIGERTRMLRRMQISFGRCQELGDEKISIVQQMNEAIEAQKKDVDCSAYRFKTTYMPELLKEDQETSGSKRPTETRSNRRGGAAKRPKTNNNHYANKNEKDKSLSHSSYSSGANASAASSSGYNGSATPSSTSSASSSSCRISSSNHHPLTSSELAASLHSQANHLHHHPRSLSSTAKDSPSSAKASSKKPERNHYYNSNKPSSKNHNHHHETKNGKIGSPAAHRNSTNSGSTNDIAATSIPSATILSTPNRSSFHSPKHPSGKNHKSSGRGGLSTPVSGVTGTGLTNGTTPTGNKTPILHKPSKSSKKKIKIIKNKTKPNKKTIFPSDRDPVRSPSPLSHDEIAANPDEPTYCHCEQVSYGNMIACDNKDCQIEWFHFSCVGLSSKPKGKWYCPVCTKDRRRQRNR